MKTTPYELTKINFFTERRDLAERTCSLAFFPVDDAVTVDREAIIAEAGRQRLFDICYTVCEIISEQLESGRGHYRDGEGRLLQTLDEVVRWLAQL